MLQCVKMKVLGSCNLAHCQGEGKRQIKRIVPPNCPQTRWVVYARATVEIHIFLCCDANFVQLITKVDCPRIPIFPLCHSHCCCHQGVGVGNPIPGASEHPSGSWFICVFVEYKILSSILYSYWIDTSSKEIFSGKHKTKLVS